MTAVVELRGDLFAFAERGHVVVPTNLRWRKDGTAVMGAGVAKAAADRWPFLPARYGAWLRSNPIVWVTSFEWQTGCEVILLPTKHAPSEPADLGLIENALIELAGWPGTTPVFLPLLGCGLGGLSESDVMPLLHKWLTVPGSDDRFRLVRP